MLKLKKGDKALAIADYLSSEPHGFEDNAEITFVKMITEHVYCFEGMIDGELSEAYITRCDFDINEYTIEIINAYDEIAWYSKLIGKKYRVLEISENEDIKVKRGNGRYSYWVGKNDYRFVEGN